MDLTLPFLGPIGPSIDKLTLLSGVFEDSSSINANISGTATEVKVDVTMPILSNTSVLKNPLLGIDASVVEATSDSKKNINIFADAYLYDFNYNIGNVLNIITSHPYYACKIVGNSLKIEKVLISGRATQYADNTLKATISYSNNSSIIQVPVTSIIGTCIDKFELPAEINQNDHKVVVPINSFEISVSIPMNFIGNAISFSHAGVYMNSVINNADVLISSTIYNEDTVRHQISNIDQGLAKGIIRIFPNQWTMCFANKPVNKDGTNATVSSFLIKALVDKYGKDIYKKISMIVAKHPETGEEYNYIVQDGYITPAGSMNDFSMCYLKDNIYYPIPFMIQSITNDTLEIEWNVK